MADSRRVERVTGYVVGGISPFRAEAGAAGVYGLYPQNYLKQFLLVPADVVSILKSGRLIYKI